MQAQKLVKEQRQEKKEVDDAVLTRKRQCIVATWKRQHIEQEKNEVEEAVTRERRRIDKEFDEMQHNHEQAIQEIGHFMVLNEVEVIATKEFALFSQHHTITNLKKNLKQKIESIPRLDAIVMAIILESVGQVIGPDKTISIINSSPSKTSRFTTYL